MLRCVLDEGAYLPKKAHKTDAGFDLRTPIDVVVPSNGSAVVDIGVHVEIPEGYVGMIKSKSGLNVKHNIQCEGVVDCEFVGSIVAKVYNHGDTPYFFNKGDKITQLVIQKIHDDNEFEIVDSLEDTERGSSGFGSTGR